MILRIHSQKMQNESGCHKYSIMEAGVEICAVNQKRYLRAILADFGVKIGQRIYRDETGESFLLDGVKE